MTNEQKKTASNLAALMPGSTWRPDPYTTPDGDALLGDDSVLVWFSKTIRSDELEDDGRRKVIGHEDLGASRISADGTVVWVKVAA